ncbi:GerAB/ArcD/ProY family transporter [Clostridium rectalis]|uniref:GerAB/ArcD/ProY family transporter n=1 Tax=Clostridium rectalis TaxID=2040295 RepID=UPI000F63C265|nr:endospore germination permease [Clostridium rectalis]
MDSNRNDLLNNEQLTIILIGSMVGIGILSLPNNVIKYAKQDSWIAAILGAIYPIYMILIANYMHKKFPKHDILELSKKYYGKILGSILNFIFIGYFLVLATEVASGTSNVLRIYITPFLKNFQALLIIILAPAYVVYKGRFALKKTNEVVFYLTAIILIIPLVAIKDGDILNIMPVFQNNFKDILKGSKETMFAYAGVEIIFLLYSYLQEKKTVVKAGMISILFSMVIYTAVIFITILYLGVNNSEKFLWATVTLTESIDVPVINSFRYIFMVLWTMIMFKTIANSYYAMTYGINRIFKKISKKSITIILYPIIFFLALCYGNPTERRAFLTKVIPPYVLFNITYVSVLAILTKIKKDDRKWVNGNL